MPWLELRLNTNEQRAEQLEDALLSSGALAVTYTDAGDQPILEPEVGTTPLWLDIVLVALYDANAKTSAIETKLRQHCDEEDLAGKNSFLWNILEDRVWEREWLKHQKPIQFGDKFWVYHEKVDSELPTLLLDPGLAFGTGSHPTTALCLEWIAQQSWEDRVVVDYGCGSGILAVAALLGGASSAVCVDIDPQALQATGVNAQRNDISADRVKLFFPNEEPLEKAPVLLANILSGPLVQLAPSLADKIEYGGQICLSGILREQETDVLNAYRAWFENLETAYSGDWIRITGTRNAKSTEAPE